MTKKLTKSNTNIVLTGTLAGIAEYFNIDATIIRLLYVVFVLVGRGSPFLLYILLAIVIPKAPRRDQRQQRFYEAGQAYYNNNQKRKETPRKEAEKIHDNDDNWSDF